jgi:protein-S-isoprenylcysteine O-methyltransferase Ste14
MGRAIVIVLGFVALMGGSLFGAAGRVDWSEAWAFLAVLGAFIVAAFVLIDPDTIRERAAPGPGTQGADARLASLGGLLLYPGTMIVAGLDAGRFGWSLPLHAVVEVAGLAGFVLGYGFAFWAMWTNPFFATFVRIQEDRGHRVVSEGPYAWVRHPGYAGTLFAHAVLPLALGSLWALVPAWLGCALFVVRTAGEDRTLTRELPGYDDYRRKVRWKLVPGLW